jgi:RNA polymerase sigma-70 factor (ECF subfamily)
MKRERSDQQEFEKLALVHAETLLRTARRMTGSLAHAEDAVQETLLSAWRSFHQFERFTNCRAWLFRILVNHLSKQWQKQRVSPLVQLPEEQTLENVVPIRPAYDSISHQAVRSAIDDLPVEQRSVLVLAAVEGFTCKEISSMLKLPIGTVMSRLSRARSEVRRRLLAPANPSVTPRTSGG